MKQILLMIGLVALVGCGKNPFLTKRESANIIEKAIRAKLGKPEGELTKTDLEKLGQLHLYNNRLTDVKGLEKLTQLWALTLTKNHISSVKGLGNLTQLKTLSLNQNSLTDVKGLEKLTQLTELNLGSNQLTDVKGLEKLTQLTKLMLFNNQLTDLTGLEKLTQLTYLDLGQNDDLTKAQIIKLQKALTKCTIWSPPHFWCMNHSGKQLTTWGKLHLMSNYTGLNLSHNQLTDLKGLEKITWLELLIINDNPALTKAQIDELQKSLPKCKILSNPTK